jgi:sugar/nucleoside kinase (ribokinase family)
MSESSPSYDAAVVGAFGPSTAVHLPAHGRRHGVEVTFTGMRDFVGQAGGDSALGFAALGRRTAAVGHVGDDRPGAWVPVQLDLPVVDTNGAGDALAVGFLTARVLEGRPLAEAAQRGQVAARWVCGQRSSSGPLITAAELDRLSGGGGCAAARG